MISGTCGVWASPVARTPSHAAASSGERIQLDRGLPLSGQAETVASPATPARTMAFMLLTSVGCCPYLAGDGKRSGEPAPAAASLHPTSTGSCPDALSGPVLAGVSMRMIVGRSSCTHQNVFAVRSPLLSAGGGFTKAGTAASLVAAGVRSAPASGRLRPLACAGLLSHLTSLRQFVQAVKRSEAGSRSNAQAAFGRHSQPSAFKAWPAARCRRGV